VKRGGHPPAVETWRQAAANPLQSRAEAGNTEPQGKWRHSGDKVETEWRQTLSLVFPSCFASGPAALLSVAVAPCPGKATGENRAQFPSAPAPYPARIGTASAWHAAEPGHGEPPEGQPGQRVLTHPGFAREPVANRRGPGRRPKGVVSLGAHRIASAARQAQTKQASALAPVPLASPAKAPPNADHHFAGSFKGTSIYDLVMDACSALYIKPEPAKYEAAEAGIVQAAWRILDAKLRRPGVALDSPPIVRQYLTLRLAERQAECFCALFFDAQLCLIAGEVMFEGTLTQTTVYPREVARRALELNASAVIVAHNHPSGCPEPSFADRQLTQALRAVLNVLDVRLLDHVIVGRLATVSFAERGLM